MGPPLAGFGILLLASSTCSVVGRVRGHGFGAIAGAWGGALAGLLALGLPFGMWLVGMAVTSATGAGRQPWTEMLLIMGSALLGAVLVGGGLGVRAATRAWPTRLGFGAGAAGATLAVSGAFLSLVLAEHSPMELPALVLIPVAVASMSAAGLLLGARRPSTGEP
jgi:hypothetical protein